MLKAGTWVKMKVLREASFGFFIGDGGEEILLHRRDMKEPVQLGEEISVFLFHDHENRLAATTFKPHMAAGDRGWLKVASVEPRLGLFLDQGIPKELLLPQKELPSEREWWPVAGDRLYVHIVRDKEGRMLAKRIKEDELQKAGEIIPASASLHHRFVEGTVIGMTERGATLLTDERMLGLIHHDEMQNPLRLGEGLRARVTYIREDGRMNLSMKPSKEAGLSLDAERILAELSQRGGKMPFGDESDPDTIRATFRMSKSAFKRALGKLMKEGKVVQEGGWTKLR